MTPEDVELQRHYADIRRFCWQAALDFNEQHPPSVFSTDTERETLSTRFLTATLEVASRIELFVTGAYPHSLPPDHASQPTTLEQMRREAEAAREREERR